MRIDETDLPANIFSRETFESEVTAMTEKGMTHLEAVLEICRERGLEVESVQGLVGPDMKARLEENFVELNFLKARATLPETW